MPSTTTESVGYELQRAELQTVLQSPLFVRSPTLSHLLSYLCEKAFNGQTDQIKEYSVALDVFGCKESFDQESNSIVRVEVNRLRKRLAEYYSREGADHRFRITIPVGQYVPSFEEVSASAEPPASSAPSQVVATPVRKAIGIPRGWLFWGVLSAIAILVIEVLLLRYTAEQRFASTAGLPQNATTSEPRTAVAAPEEIRILAGSNRNYMDHSGKLWSPEDYFSGGSSVPSSVRYVWRTQDSAIYRTSRQGEFRYDIPLKPGVYELRLHFAETYYGPEEATGGGEGSRIMSISANGKVLLSDFDVLADAGGGRTADVRVFTDIVPADDGLLHLQFSSSAGGAAIVSGIEILPGVRGGMKPVRIVARDVPYYSNESQWWSADIYFKGGQLGATQVPVAKTSDPELYETERWGHFSYAIPVVPGRYTVTLHFIEHRVGLPQQPDEVADSAGSIEPRVFNVFCNGKRIVSELNIREQVGENRPLVRRISNLEPNAQGKLLLEFVPVSHYATVSAIEVLPQ